MQRRRIMNRRTTSAIRLSVALLLALAWGLSLLPAAQAQAAGGNLIGRVLEKNGGPLPGVTVTATQKETGLTRRGPPFFSSTRPMRLKKNGGPLPGVTVTATQKETGLTRSTVRGP